MSDFRRKLLLVDDSKALQGLFQAGFSDADCDVFVCSTGQEAIELIEKNYIDFVCSSFYLKDMEGIELCQRVRQLTCFSSKPFVLLTSKGVSEAVSQALPAGVTDVFLKSDIASLLAYVRRFTSLRGQIDGRVLYVEDAKDQRQFLKRLLEDKGLAVDDFAMAEDAWERFQTGDYDLVLTDIVLDGSMSGFALINHIRRQPAPKGDIPILAVTAFDDKTRRIELLNLGVSDYILMPIAEEELFVRMRSLIDIQRLKREVEQSRQRLHEEELAHSNAISAAKSQFLGSMSHEFRTPLNSILGYAQLMTSDPGLDSSVRDMAEEIERAGRHLLALVNDVIDLSRIETGQLDLVLEPVALQELEKECIAMALPMAQLRGISMTMEDGDCHQVYVQVDRVRLRQVLVNLLSNAIKYNRPRGSVKLACQPGNGVVRLSITDTGRGIPVEKQSRLFNAFDRLGAESGAVEGSGIGLNLSRRITEAMGGVIGFSSKEGEGSTFWVEFPMAEAVSNVIEKALPDSVSAPRSGHGSLVIYIEDNHLNVRLMKKMFTRRPHLELLHAQDAATGIRMVQSMKPALILMDINLPDMDGYRVMDVLRSDPETAKIPVIAVTANAMLGDRERGLAAGFVGYVTKPLDVARLLELVDGLVGAA